MTDQIEQIVTIKPSMFQSMLSGASGETSSARVGTLIVILSATVWVSLCVFRTHVIPDLSSLTFYVTSVIGVLYGTNKIAETVQAIKSKSTN